MLWMIVLPLMKGEIGEAGSLGFPGRATSSWITPLAT